MAKNRIHGRRRNDYDDFHESINPAMPSDYQTVTERDINVAAASSVAEQLVVAVAYILSALLAVRFFTHLFSNDTANGFVSFMNTTTDWMTQPFQSVSGAASFFDFGAIVAVVVIGVLAYLLNRLFASMRRDDIV